MKRMCLLPALLITLVSVSLPILLRALAESTRQNELSRQETDPGAPKFVSFPSGDLTLHGFLYKPEGDGPFPAIIWNHGSEKLPGQQPELARFYTKQGFVFFTPHRHGQGRSPGAYIEDLIEKYAATEKNRTSVGKYVVKLAPFAPAAKSWANTELRKRLLEAVRDAKSPLFLIQAQNDYSLGPSEGLGPVIKRKGPPNQAKVYPPYGTTPQEGHYGFATKEGGIAIWGSEVLDFFRAASR